MKKRVIDVSSYQGDIDWDKLWTSGKIDGAILRCGYGSDFTEQDDAKWARNADACTRLGIPFGAYLVSYADTPEKAQSEAKHALRLVKPYKLSYPIYYDLEIAGKEQYAAKAAQIFGDIIERAGYWCGVYANEYWFNNLLTIKVDRFTKWCAQYTRAPKLNAAAADMWQYSESETVPGVGVTVDMSICYRDLPAEIRGAAKLSIDELAEEIWAGKWGNGEDRRQRVTAAGYDYATVQARVDEYGAAYDVLNRKYGDEPERSKKLAAAGFDPQRVQAIVNKIYNK